MPRNKNPEQTARKILEVSLKLFLEKGYDETTVLDIVNNLGGLTRGAFYHHFKSKEEVLEAIFTGYITDRHPMFKVMDMEVENGFERLKLVFKSGLAANFENSDVGDISRLAMSLMQKPRFLAEQLKGNQETAALLVPIIEEGMADGSIKPGNPKIIAELAMLLINFWLIPSIFPCSMEETFEKAEIIDKILTQLGIPVLDDEMGEMYMKAADLFGWPT